jgi:site-specific DNA recombinase
MPTPPLRRAAIYSRFSTDLQSETSCEDQAALCRGLAAREGLAVTAEYEDRAVSGASTLNRLGLRRLLRDAREKRFDVVLCEGLDRLSRDQADLARMKKELAFLGVGIVTAQDGAVGAIHIGLKGLMSELFLADLAQRTRRGLAGRVRAGLSAGGRSYGYDPDPAATGGLIVNDAEAAVVRRIFAAYLSGDNARSIAGALNREGIAGPRGGKWNASTISGSRSRQNGILQNALYAGERVWNRQRFVKDPATGRRVSRLNPEAEWHRSDAPELRIVDSGTFAAVQQRRTALGQVQSAHHRRPRHILSGLLRCASCGASYTVVGRGRIGCAGYHERGDCTNNRTVALRHVEARVLGALRDQLSSPALLGEYVRTFRAEAERLAAERGTATPKRAARMSQLEAAIARAVDLLVEGKAPAALMDKLRTMEAEKAALEAEAATAAPAVVLLRPDAASRFRAIVADLEAYLTRLMPGEPADRLVERTRALIDHVVITAPAESKKPVGLRVHGLLAELLTTHPQYRGVMVAGTGFEPVTFRL